MPETALIEQRSVARPPIAGHRSPLRLAAVVLLLVTPTVQILLGVAWWIVNLTAIPPYGDTEEYLQLAQTLHPDTYRTVFYPVVLRVLEDVSGWLHLPLAPTVYVVQTSAAILAICCLVSVLWSISARHAPGLRLQQVGAARRRLSIAAATLALVTLPLVAHLAESILTDSLSLSLLLLALAGLLRIAVMRSRSWMLIVATLLAVAAAELMRPEKLYVLAPLLGLATVICAITPHLRKAGTGRVGALLLCAVVPTAFVVALNHETQTANLGRAPLTLDVRLFDRAVYPHLEALRPMLSPQLQTVVTPADARAFDAAANTQQEAPMILELQAAAGGSDALLNQVRDAALRCCWKRIVVNSAEDTISYSAGPITFVVEYIAGNPTSTWTTSRMAAAHPILTTVYLWVSFATLVPLLLLASLPLVTVRRRWSGGVAATVLVLLAVCLLNGAAFGMTSGTFVNVRYALPSYALLTACLWWSALAGARQRQLTIGSTGQSW